MDEIFNEMGRRGIFLVRLGVLGGILRWVTLFYDQGPPETVHSAEIHECNCEFCHMWMFGAAEAWAEWDDSLIRLFEQVVDRENLKWERSSAATAVPDADLASSEAYEITLHRDIRCFSLSGCSDPPEEVDKPSYRFEERFFQS